MPDSTLTLCQSRTDHSLKDKREVKLRTQKISLAIWYTWGAREGRGACEINSLSPCCCTQLITNSTLLKNFGNYYRRPDVAVVMWFLYDLWSLDFSPISLWSGWVESEVRSRSLREQYSRCPNHALPPSLYSIFQLFKLPTVQAGRKLQENQTGSWKSFF